MTDSSGVISETMDYYPFGALRLDQQASGGGGGPIGFNEQRKFIGQEYDADTNLAYLNARYYNATLARFTSEDPMFWNFDQKWLADPQQQNSYAYARNNPIIISDPSGNLGVASIPGVFSGAVKELVNIPYSIGKTVVNSGSAVKGVYNFLSKAIAGGPPSKSDWADSIQAVSTGVQNARQAFNNASDFDQGQMIGSEGVFLGLFAVGGLEAEGGEMASIERGALSEHVQGVVEHLESNNFMKSPEGHYHPYGHEYENRPVNGKPLLPIQDKGYYTSWDTHNANNRGIERLVTGKSGEVYYSNTHYGKTGDPAFSKVINNK